MVKDRSRAGFTIVELLIVIVVIAILAAIGVVAYEGIQERARNAKIAQDSAALQKAIMLAREATGKTLLAITGNTFTAYGCSSKSVGTNLATLPKTDICWTAYTSALTKIYEASGSDVRGLVDPWGRPYAIDENEGENGSNCNKDEVAIYPHPFTSSRRRIVAIPLSGYSGCSL